MRNKEGSAQQELNQSPLEFQETEDSSGWPRVLAFLSLPHCFPDVWPGPPAHVPLCSCLLGPKVEWHALWLPSSQYALQARGTHSLTGENLLVSGFLWPAVQTGCFGTRRCMLGPGIAAPDLHAWPRNPGIARSSVVLAGWANQQHLKP